MPAAALTVPEDNVAELAALPLELELEVRRRGAALLKKLNSQAKTEAPLLNKISWSEMDRRRETDLIASSPVSASPRNITSMAGAPLQRALSPSLPATESAVKISLIFGKSLIGVVGPS